MKKVMRQILAGLVGLIMMTIGLTMGNPPSSSRFASVAREEAPDFITYLAPLN